MTNRYVASKMRYFTVFSLLVFHSWANVYFFMNQENAASYLQFLHNTTYYFDRKILPGILDLKFVEENQECESQSGYSQMKDVMWPGTKQGVYISAMNYDKVCSIDDCTGKTSFSNYNKDRCYAHFVDEIKTGHWTTCCLFTLNTNFPNLCKNLRSGCQCPAVYVAIDKFDNKTSDRVITQLNIIPPTSMIRIENKKMCSKLYTDYELFNSTCEGGKYCFNYICIKNTTTCPDYSQVSEFLNLNKNKPIYEININYNGIKCPSYTRSKKFNTKLIEEGHYLSNLLPLQKLNEDSCEYINTTTYDQDVILGKILRSSEFYAKNGILDKINQNIDGLTPDVNYKYSTFLNDTVYISGSSHVNLDSDMLSSNSNCTAKDIFNKLDSAVLYADYLVKYNQYNFIFYFNAVLLIILCVVNSLSYFNTKSFYENKSSLANLIIIFNFFYFIYNLINYFVKNQEDSLNVFVGDIDKFSVCFSDKQYLNYLNEVKFGLDNYNFLFNITLKNILIENSVVIFLLGILMFRDISFKK